MNPVIQKTRKCSKGGKPVWFLPALLSLAATSAFGEGSGGVVVLAPRVQESQTDVVAPSFSTLNSSSVVPVASRIATDGAVEISGTAPDVSSAQSSMAVVGESPLVVESDWRVLSTGTNYEISLPVAVASKVSYQFEGGPLVQSSGGSGGIIVACTGLNPSVSTVAVVSGEQVALDVPTALSNPFTPYTLTIWNDTLTESATVTLESDGSTLKIKVLRNSCATTACAQG